MSIKQRMYPTSAQAALMLEWCHQARFIYNVQVAEFRARNNLRSSGGAWVDERSPQDKIKRLRTRLPWLSAGPSIVHQSASRDFERALTNYHAGRADAPDFHRKDSRSGGFAVRDVTLRRLNRRWATISVPKVGPVRFRISRQWTEITAATSARVRLDDGRWHVSLTVPAREKIVAGTGLIVGIDRGVKNTIATSDGVLSRIPTLTPGQQERWRRLEGTKVLTMKGSKRRARVLDQMASLRRRQNDLATNWIEQTTTALARSYDLIVIEDLRLTNMMRRPEPISSPADPGKFLPNGASAKSGLNRVLHASRMGRFATRLQDKTSAVVKVDPRNTSRRCPECGHTAAENRESQAVFVCRRCGHRANADLNAARNILQRGVEGNGAMQGLEPADGGEWAAAPAYAGTSASDRRAAQWHHR